MAFFRQPVPLRLRTTIAMGLMALSSALLASMHASIRLVPGGMHPYQIAFFRNLFGLVALTLMQGKHAPGALRTRKLKLHVWRGVLNVISMLAFFKGVMITPLAQVASLTFLGPLLASVLAFLVFREGGVVRRMSAFGLGLIGALLILRPGVTEVGTGPLLVLFSAVVWAASLLVIKVLSRTESSMTIGMYMVVVMTPISALAAWPHWMSPGLDQLAWLMLTGLLGTAGQVLLAQSFRMADASAVLPLDFFKLIWSSLLGYSLFGEVPTIWVYLGGTLIFGSGVWLALKERNIPAESAPEVTPDGPSGSPAPAGTAASPRPPGAPAR